MSMENRAIVRRLYEEVWNKRRFELLDELISPSYDLQAAHLAGPVIGPEAYKYYVLAFFKGFPDFRWGLCGLPIKSNLSREVGDLRMCGAHPNQ